MYHACGTAFCLATPQALPSACRLARTPRAISRARLRSGEAKRGKRSMPSPLTLCLLHIT